MTDSRPQTHLPQTHLPQTHIPLHVPDALAPLLAVIDGLEQVARRLRPAAIDALLAPLARPFADLEQTRTAAGAEADPIAALVDACSYSACRTVEQLLAAVGQADELRRAYRALRGLAVALEQLYPLAGVLEPVNRFFLDPPQRDDPAYRLRQPLAEPPPDSGVLQFGEAERGGFWMYVPESRIDGTPLPLVVALHGGAGSGRQFLWRWLRSARSRQVILVAPTAIGDTWAIAGDDPDSPNLAAIVEFVCTEWPVDRRRLLLTGMSDGGTFSYTSGLEPGSPFTHLAPVCAHFHPLLASMAPPERVQGLPIHIVHGALDWMFPVEIGRRASVALQKAGAAVAYTEIDDLSHTYPSEVNGALLDWLDEELPMKDYR